MIKIKAGLRRAGVFGKSGGIQKWVRRKMDEVQKKWAARGRPYNFIMLHCKT